VSIECFYLQNHNQHWDGASVNNPKRPSLNRHASQVCGARTAALARSAVWGSGIFPTGAKTAPPDNYQHHINLPKTR